MGVLIALFAVGMLLVIFGLGYELYCRLEAKIRGHR